MVKIKRGLVLLFVTMFFLNLISANFEIGNISHSIETAYAPEANIRAWINISLINESTDSFFTDSFDNSISLIDLLNIKSNSEYEYNCELADCGMEYDLNNQEATKEFSLSNRESKLVGVKVIGNGMVINSINFNVQSNAGISCENQLKIDILNDGVFDFGNNKTFNDVCSLSKNYGCYNESKSPLKIILGEAPYCQRTTLSESPGFKIGTWIEKKSGSRELAMKLYDLNGELKTQCTLPDASELGGEISCDIDYLVLKPSDYYVCLSSVQGDGVYNLKGYADSNGCGFHRLPYLSVSENAAYSLFVEGKKFGSVGLLKVENSLENGNSLASLANDYILKKYKTSDCSNGCIIPISINSGKSQTLTISDLSVSYDTDVLSVIEDKFFDLNAIPAKLNSDFQKLYLDDGNFSVSPNYGDFDFKLFLNEIEIISEEIKIENMPNIRALIPEKTISAFPTNFKVIIEPKENISEYQWEFGDGTNEVTQTNSILHVFNSTGNYELKLTITNLKGIKTYRTFEIIVDSPEKVIEELIDEKQAKLQFIKLQVKNFSSNYQDELESILEMKSLEDDIKRIQRNYVASSSEQEYNQIMTNLLELKIPKSIIVTNKAEEILFYPKKEIIDLETIKLVAGGNYESYKENDYKNSVLSWNQENTEVRMTFEELSAIYEDSSPSLFKVFELNINKESYSGKNPYLIIEKMQGLKFLDNYLEEENSGYYSIELKELNQKIKFLINEQIDFSELPAFVSPELSRLSVEEISIEDKDEKMSKWVFFALILILLIIFAVVGYIILQEWYKKKYENYLFKNKNNLYNMINYIDNSIRNKIKKSEIISALKKVGWNSEQINYVFKKYYGKRTGMIELPIGKILEKLKKKNPQKTIRNRNVAPRGFSPKNKNPNRSNKYMSG